MFVNKKKALLFSLIVTIIFVFIISNNKIPLKDEPIESDNEVTNNSSNEIPSNTPDSNEATNNSSNEISLEESNNVETNNEIDNETPLDTSESNEKILYEMFYSDERENHKNKIIILFKNIDSTEYYKVTGEEALEILEWIECFESYDEENIANIINLANSVDGIYAEELSIIIYKIYLQDKLNFVDILSRYKDNEELIEKTCGCIFYDAYMRDEQNDVIDETKELLNNKDITPVQKELIEKMVDYMEELRKINS